MESRDDRVDAGAPRPEGPIVGGIGGPVVRRLRTGRPARERSRPGAPAAHGRTTRSLGGQHRRGGVLRRPADGTPRRRLRRSTRAAARGVPRQLPGHGGRRGRARCRRSDGSLDRRCCSRWSGRGRRTDDGQRVRRRGAPAPGLGSAHRLVPHGLRRRSGRRPAHRRHLRRRSTGARLDRQWRRDPRRHVRRSHRAPAPTPGQRASPQGRCRAGPRRRRRPPQPVRGVPADVAAGDDRGAELPQSDAARDARGIRGRAVDDGLGLPRRLGRRRVPVPGMRADGRAPHGAFRAGGWADRQLHRVRRDGRQLAPQRREQGCSRRRRARERRHRLPVRLHRRDADGGSAGP